MNNEIRLLPQLNKNENYNNNGNRPFETSRFFISTYDCYNFFLNDNTIQPLFVDRQLNFFQAFPFCFRN